MFWRFGSNYYYSCYSFLKYYYSIITKLNCLNKYKSKPLINIWEFCSLINDAWTWSLNDSDFLGRILFLKEVEVVNGLLDKLLPRSLLLDQLFILCLIEEIEDALGVMLRACPGWDLLGNRGVWPPDELSLQLLLVISNLLLKAKRVEEWAWLTDCPWCFCRIWDHCHLAHSELSWSQSTPQTSWSCSVSRRVGCQSYQSNLSDCSIAHLCSCFGEFELLSKLVLFELTEVSWDLPELWK